MDSENYISIDVEADKDLVCTRWLKTVSSRNYRSTVIHFFKVIKKYRPVYWLLDMNRLSSPTMDDQRWTMQYINQALKGTSIKKVAVVLPNDLLLELVMERIWEGVDEELKKRIPAEYFRMTSQALRWLLPAYETEGLFREEAVKGKPD